MPGCTGYIINGKFISTEDYRRQVEEQEQKKRDQKAMEIKRRGGVYLTQKHEDIAGTVRLLKFFLEFLNSNYQYMKDPYEKWETIKLTKEQAKAKLAYLVNMAINRKACYASSLPEEPKGRKFQPMYQTDLRRDYNTLNDHLQHRIIVRRFNLPEMNVRFAHHLYAD